ncbi:trypsin-like serine protease [bacterium]|nr:trypsin-like serine protease [bacterium]
MKRTIFLPIVVLMVLLVFVTFSLEDSNADVGTDEDVQNVLAQADQPDPLADATRPLPTETPAPVARIVGGAPATHGEWPWQVVVYPPGFICGGVLIAPEWVVTAGHCVTSGTNIYAPGQMQVVLGEYQRNVNDGSEQFKQVTQVVRHPNYNNSTLDFDIALLRLASAATPTTFVSTVPLLRSPADDALVSPGAVTWVTGWGLTSNAPGSTASQILMEVDLPIVPNAACGQVWNGITANMLCAGYTEGGKDSCGGDSGGPLVAGTPGNWKLAGLVSFGSVTCGEPNVPGVYTRVSRFVDWIESYTGPLNNPPTTATATTTTTATPTATATQAPTQTNTPTPSATPTKTATPTMTATPTQAPPTPSANVLRNSNFDLGRNGDWLEEGQQIKQRIYTTNATTLPAQPFSGTSLAWFGAVDNEVARLSQQVTVPQVAPILSFRYQIRSADACGRDMLYVYLGNRLVTSLELCAQNATASWLETPAFDLGFAAGAQSTLRFDVVTDGATPSSLLLEDVSLRSNTAIPTPIATSPSQILQNPDFDAGPDGAWAERSTTFGSNPGALILSKDDVALPVLPHSGEYLVWLGGTANETGSISQTVSINGVGQQLTYRYRIGSQDQCGKDRVDVRFGGALLTQYNLCSSTATSAWTQATIDMNSYSGQTGDLVFQISNDNAINSNFFLDSTSLTVVPAAATPTATSTSAPTPAVTATPTAEALHLDAVGGPKSIALTWNPSAQIETTNYVIQRQDNGNFVGLAMTGETFYVDADDNAANALTVDSEYCYRIVAVDAADSPLETSNVACATFGRLHIEVNAPATVSGESVLVSLNAGQVNGLRIAAGDLWLEYDPTVASPTGVRGAALTEKYKWLYTVTPVNGTTERLSIQVAPQTPDTPAPLYGAGTLAHIDFDVLSPAGTETTLDLVAPSIGSGSQVTATVGAAETEVVALTLIDGSLSVGAAGTAYRLGDINGDGVTTVQDAMQALVLSAQTRPATDQELNSGDINGNGIIDAGDSALIMRQVNAGRATSTREGMTEQATQTSTTVRVEVLSAVPGAEAVLVLRGEALQQVRGGDFVLVYDPAKIAGFRSVSPIGLATGSTQVTLYDDRHGRLYVSLSNATAISGDGSLLEIRALLQTGVTEPTEIVLAAVTLYDNAGRDFVRSTLGNVIIRQNGTVTPSGRAIFLPDIQR